MTNFSLQEHFIKKIVYVLFPGKKKKESKMAGEVWSKRDLKKISFAWINKKVFTTASQFKASPNFPPFLLSIKKNPL